MSPPGLPRTDNLTTSFYHKNIGDPACVSTAWYVVLVCSPACVVSLMPRRQVWAMEVIPSYKCLQKHVTPVKSLATRLQFTACRLQTHFQCFEQGARAFTQKNHNFRTNAYRKLEGSGPGPLACFRCLGRVSKWRKRGYHPSLGYFRR